MAAALRFFSRGPGQALPQYARSAQCGIPSAPRQPGGRFRQTRSSPGWWGLLAGRSALSFSSASQLWGPLTPISRSGFVKHFHARQRFQAARADDLRIVTTSYSHSCTSAWSTFVPMILLSIPCVICLRWMMHANNVWYASSTAAPASGRLKPYLDTRQVNLWAITLHD